MEKNKTRLLILQHHKFEFNNHLIAKSYADIQNRNIGYNDRLSFFNAIRKPMVFFNAEKKELGDFLLKEMDLFIKKQIAEYEEESVAFVEYFSNLYKMVDEKRPFHIDEKIIKTSNSVELRNLLNCIFLFPETMQDEGCLMNIINQLYP